TDALPIYSPGYAATEAMMGINPYKDKIRYVIVPDTVFYEFIKEEDIKKKKPKVYGIDKIFKGHNYEIVVTNYAGLYRYRLGDVLRVVDFYNKAPVIEFLYRKNQALNMIAEKTTEDQLTAAMKNTVKDLKLKLIDYTTIPDNSITPGRYTFYFELKNSIDEKALIEIERTLDMELRKANLAYDRARNNRKLSRVKIKLVKSNSFSIMKNSLMGKGISKSQIKIPRVLNNHPKLVSFLEERKL
ncbi:MAG: GH3 auxin-responsive promoter family protein, partial [Clostridiaceae bacterium]|nr:GH3 auxin-responsive promoter family protein [Clostridiaceae bacterium]